MKILITGGAGFIGSHIVDTYIEHRHKVVVVDNLSTGNKNHINPRALFYKTNVCDEKRILDIFKKEKPEVVNHHAANVSVSESIRNPQVTLEINTKGTLNILQAFSAYHTGKKPHFILASTGGALYGDPRKLPATESSPILPLSPYGLSKYLAEEIVRYYAKEHGIQFTILRYANVYGPRQNPRGEGGVVIMFRKSILENKRPTIFGDGTKTRDYVYVGDIAHANLLALAKPKNCAINIGTGKETSDKQVFDAIAKNLNYKGKPIYTPFRKGEVRRSVLSTNLAKKILDWRNNLSFNEGIAKTLNH